MSNKVTTVETIKNKDRFIRQLMVYTVLFVIMALGVFFVFYVAGRSFLQDCDGNIDGIAQQYPTYTWLKRMMEGVIAGEGFNFWSWDIGLGDDAFITFNGKLLNPLTYICLLFPYKYLDIGYGFMTMVSQYLCGLSFMIFSRGIGFKGNKVVMGGLCYAFSAWIIYSMIRQCSFTTVTILLPLIILGVEKIYKKQSPLLFIIMVGLHLLYGVQWAYIDAIIVIVYFVVRYFWYCSGEGFLSFIKKFAAFMAYGLVGIMLAMPVIIQNLFKYGNATTSSTVESYPFFSIKDYLTFPAGLFELNVVQEPYSVMTLPVICIVLLPIVVISLKKKSTAAILTVGFLVASLLPITGSILNGFSYSVGRWYYILAFFMVWAAMEVANRQTFASKKNIAIMTTWMVLLLIWNVGICYLFLGILSRNAAICTFIGVILGILLIVVCNLKSTDRWKLAFPRLGKGATANLVIMVIVFVSTAGYANMLFFPGVSDYIYKLDMIGAAKEKLDGSTQHIGPEIQKEDKSFYRIDQVDGYSDTRVARVRANENIYFGNRSIYTYFSSMDSGWHKYNKIMGNNAGYFDRTTSFSNDNRAGLDFLFGVKYFLGDNPKFKPGASEYAAYGFTSVTKIDNIEVLQSRYNMGLGTAYPMYITQSELMEYSELEREQVIMQAAVIPDEEASKVRNLKHGTKSQIKTDIRPVEYTISPGERMSIGNGTIQVKENEEDRGGDFNITIPEVNNAQVFVVFKNLIREKASYMDNRMLRTPETTNTEIDTLEEKLDAQGYKDNEKFQILLSHGNVAKAAQCRKSKNQGFSDVKDYYINLGYFNHIEGDINCYIDRLGNYTYDSIEVYAMPMDIYAENAQILQDNRYEIESYENDSVIGQFNLSENSLMYFSILDTPGWHIYVDGQEVEKVKDVNITFTGAVIPKGNHQVQLVYRTPGLKIGLGIMALGIVIMICIAVLNKRKRNER